MKKGKLEIYVSGVYSQYELVGKFPKKDITASYYNSNSNGNYGNYGNRSSNFIRRSSKFNTHYTNVNSNEYADK